MPHSENGSFTIDISPLTKEVVIGKTKTTKDGVEWKTREKLGSDEALNLAIGILKLELEKFNKSQNENTSAITFSGETENIHFEVEKNNKGKS